jgi:hypothetical protein
MAQRLVIGAIFGLLLMAGQAGAAQYGGIRELFVGPSIEYFRWEEFSGGSKLLTEQGPRFGVDGTIVLDLLKTGEAGSLSFKGKLGLFGGVVDYDGQTQPPNSLPVKTDVTYVGAREEVAIGWAFPAGDGRIEPFAGLGYRWWLRDLQDSTAFDPALSGGRGGTVVVSGYTEEWESVYTKVGMAFSHPLDGSWQLFAEAGGKYPFYNTNTVDIALAGKKTVRPEPRWSAFAELGARYKRFRPAVYYEGYRTGQSEVVDTGLVNARGNRIGIFQPRSDEDVVGVSFSYCFR